VIVEFVLLDVFQVQAAGHIVDVGPAKQRILLAALAVDAGRPVPVESLIDRIWDDDGPNDARRVLHTYVARVRRVLKEAQSGHLTEVRLERRSGGYQLVCDPDLIDLQRFRRLVGRARSLDRSDPNRAALLGEALALWRAEPLAGLPGGWATRMREGLRKQHLEAANDWADAELTLGRPTNVIQHLPELIVQYPLAESLVARLMRALNVAGRDAEALQVYAQARQRIADELGSEPGIELRTLHQTVLRQGSPFAAREATASPTAAWSTTDSEQTGPAPVTAYHQLPRDIADFTGREAELLTLTEAATKPHNTAVTLLAIEGMGGIGKTRLAVHTAHQLIALGRYGDLQLYADLRGFSHDGVPADPRDVLDSFLRLLGVPPDRIPADLESRSAVFRDRLAAQHALVLLDDAADQDQIAPILPASKTCLVIVTSRRSLTLPGAQTLRLDPFTPEEAIALLTNAVGHDRAAAEPEALREIVTRCGGLPLAVTLAAQKLRIRPAVSRRSRRACGGTIPPLILS
jgi:DNA-binding SARP family transcriptional activator